MTEEAAPRAGVVACTVHVRGFVQGVFFREGCRRMAERLGVCGTVENLPDGRVRGCFEGPKAAVEELIDWCYQGTDRARVEGVEVAEAEPSGRSGFSILGRS